MDFFGLYLQIGIKSIDQVIPGNFESTKKADRSHFGKCQYKGKFCDCGMIKICLMNQCRRKCLKLKEEDLQVIHRLLILFNGKLYQELLRNQGFYSLLFIRQ